MKLVYLAGPFTASTPWGIEENIRAAESAAACILARRDDVALIVPHSIGRHFVGRAGTPGYWYAATMRMLEACEVIVMIDGWQKSSGSREEFKVAAGMGTQVFLSPDDFAANLRPLNEAEIARIMEAIQ